MKKSSAMLKSLAIGLCATAIITSCTSKSGSEDLNSQQIITEEMRKDLIAMGFNAEDAKITRVHVDPLDANSAQIFALQLEDVIIPVDEFEQMRHQHKNNSKGNKGVKNGKTEQYRTFNLVTRLPRTLRVLGWTGGSQALSSAERTALQWAIDNYNNVGTGLRLSLTFGTNQSTADIVVYFDPSVSGSGGEADFPTSNGNPNKYVRIYGLRNFNTNVIEHVITHEIGHCVGFRHTDYFDRRSCGSFDPESAGSVGAVYIPGTGTDRSDPNFDTNSIMISCFSASEDGEFSAQDITALNFLY